MTARSDLGFYFDEYIRRKIARGLLVECGLRVKFIG
jgi:hypothetical protein